MQGVKLSAPNLEHAVAGTQLCVLRDGDDEDEVKDLVMADMSDIFERKQGEGVCVQASTLGSLEALLEFLGSEAVRSCGVPFCSSCLLCWVIVYCGAVAARGSNSLAPKWCAPAQFALLTAPRGGCRCRSP